MQAGRLKVMAGLWVTIQDGRARVHEASVAPGGIREPHNTTETLATLLAALEPYLRIAGSEDEQDRVRWRLIELGDLSPYARSVLRELIDVL